MPYASVVIPTHDRHSTLALSVMSVQRQSVSDIEILIVGDGCTPEVRAVALGLASSDRRIRFLDLQKAPLRGAANRDHAIRVATSDRIFYNDDDDLFLTNHVERLGAALDYSEIVDTPAASVEESGKVALGIHDSGFEVFRSLLAEGRYKAVFDTHLAHRRATYMDRAGWLRATDRRVVLHLLTSFLEPPAARWSTIFETTALSFHGMARAGTPDDVRAAELKTWFRRIETSHAEVSIRQGGSYAFHSFVLMHSMTSLDPNTRRGTVEHLQAMLASDPTATVEQREVFDFVTALLSGGSANPDIGGRFLDDILDSGLGPEFIGPTVLSALTSSAMRGHVAEWIDACRERPAVSLARFWLKAAEGRHTHRDLEVMRDIEASIQPWRQHFFGLAVAVALAQSGNWESAWGYLGPLEVSAPIGRHGSAYWQTREEVARQLGLENEAIRAHQENASTTSAA